VDRAEHEIEGAPHEAVDFFRVEPLGQRGEPGDVDEQHRDLLTFALKRGPGGEDLLGQVLRRVGLGRGEARLSRLVERRRALAAELVAGGVVRPARGADEGEQGGISWS
jgi:hypothetical protein